MGLPSKGRMAEDTLDLLQECQLKADKINPRQYAAKIKQLPGVEVWFQRATDVVRKIKYGDIDIGIVGMDMVQELGDSDSSLVVAHDNLQFGQCHLALAVPMYGKFEKVNSIQDLIQMRDWNETNPLRVVTGYQSLARKYFQEIGFSNVIILTGDGALEAAPAMNSADVILDLVSTGVTLRENNLKEIEGGTVLKSQGILVANKQSIMHRPGVVEIIKELIERFEAHFKASQFYTFVANIRGQSAEAVADKLNKSHLLSGLSGPTISQVYPPGEQNGHGGLYSVTLCVRKPELYNSIKEMRKVGGSGVLVSPVTYIFDEESPVWLDFKQRMGISDDKA